MLLSKEERVQHRCDANKKYYLKHPDGQRQRYIANRSEIRARQKTYYRNHSEQIKTAARKWCKNNLEKVFYRQKRWRLNKEYGISMERFQEMLLEQNYLCMICNTNKATHVDHDHETGTVRSILCHKCNMAISLLHEDSDIALSAAEYLERWGR